MAGKQVLLLGLGEQGRAALWDLSRDPSIETLRICDPSPETAEVASRYGGGKETILPLSAEDPKGLLREMERADGVLETLPGRFALPVARLAARAGVPTVSTMYLADPGERDPQRRLAQQEELIALDEEARRTGAILLPECGMDPGLDLVLCKEALRGFETVESLVSYGAGFPEAAAADNPLGYRFTWSIPGVMRSYLRPALVIRGGKACPIPAEAVFAPENTHLLHIPEMEGPLECFPNGDVRPFLERFALEGVREFGRYVCRWPGHCAFWSVLARCGFLDDSPVRTPSGPVVPQEFCAAVLGRREEFRYGAGQRDVALVRVEVQGRIAGQPRRRVLQLVDRRDLATGFTAMQRTVGFTAALGLRFLLKGILPPGLHHPEELPFEPFAQALRNRGMEIARSETPAGV